MENIQRFRCDKIFFLNIQRFRFDKKSFKNIERFRCDKFFFLSSVLGKISSVFDLTKKKVFFYPAFWVGPLYFDLFVKSKFLIGRETQVEVKF